MTPEHVKQGSQSVTITGLVITLLSSLAIMFDLDVGMEEIAGVVTSAGTLIGIALAWYGRVRKGDITWYGRRIKGDV